MIRFNSKRVENTLRRIVNKIANDKQDLFVKPLNKTLRSIRALIKRDPEIGGRSHVASGRLLENTRIQVKGETKDSIRIELGMFVPYGQELEQGTEAGDVNFDRLLDWAKAKGFANPESVAARVRNKLRNQGTPAYRLLERTFNQERREAYRDSVFTKIKRLFRIQ
jgi:hypothetical protein